MNEACRYICNPCGHQWLYEPPHSSRNDDGRPRKMTEIALTLNERQRQFVNLQAQGKSIAEIAAVFGVSVSRTRQYAGAIKRKLERQEDLRRRKTCPKCGASDTEPDAKSLEPNELGITFLAYSEPGICGQCCQPEAAHFGAEKLCPKVAGLTDAEPDKESVQ